MAATYQVCVNCVMDTSDTRISFDENGVCDHCRDFYANVKPRWDTGPQGRRQLDTILAEIRAAGKGRKYDCLLGLSGGVDSSYMLHLAVTELGLRPLVFHVDGGWDMDFAVHNVHSMVERLGLDLHNEVIDWEDMRAFQIALLKSGVPHIDVPQDHAFIAVLYNYALRFGVKYILNGGNISTECVRNPLEYYYYGTDMAQIRDIWRRFGAGELKSYPFSPILRHKLWLRYVRGIKVIKLLNYVPYIRTDAAKLLEREYGWSDYPQKHFESRFTRFVEGHWLPARFGFDPRRVQFSSLILTGQMKREDALKRLERPALDPETVDAEFAYIAERLRVSVEELRGYFAMPKKFYWDYRNQDWLFNLGAKALRAVGVERAIKR